ncbi:MAG: SDR family NAD(P)-dependent oxidoreductase [Planctomycetales bacterium]
MGVLQDKVAIITGAGGGLGRSYALLFAKEGAKVVVNDPGVARDGTGGGNAAEQVVAEIKAAGGQAVANTEAVGSAAVAERLVKTAVDAFGKLDILVNNAGILRDRTILNMTEEEFDQVIHVHLRGTFTCLQAAGRQMKEQGTGGRIINVSSIAGLIGSFGQANYSAAKAGIYALTRTAALEFMKLKITVNAIAPLAMTRMLSTAPEFASGHANDHLTIEQVGPVLAFLASDMATGITGQIIGAEGEQLFAYRMMTTHGTTRYNPEGSWTVQEVAQAMPQILHG